MKPITIWSKHGKDKKGNPTLEFNHIEDDHCPNDIPTHRHPAHKAWNGSKWQKEFGHLSDTIPPVVIRAKEE